MHGELECLLDVVRNELDLILSAGLVSYDDDDSQSESEERKSSPTKTGKNVHNTHVRITIAILCSPFPSLLAVRFRFG